MGIFTSPESDRNDSKSQGKVSTDRSPHNEQEKVEVIDERLVEEVRKLLKEDWKKNGKDYSEQHYAELIDDNSPYTCWRYIISQEYSVENAVELMKESLKWRKENHILECTDSDFIKEFWFFSAINFTGLAETENEDVLYIMGKNYRKPNSILEKYTLKFIGHTIFQWDFRNRHNLNKFKMVFDETNVGYGNTDIDLMRWLITAKEYIPGRIEVIYVVGLPFIIQPVVNLLMRLVTPSFRKIIQYCTFEELVTKYIRSESLPPELGGTAYRAYLAPIEAPWMVDVPLFMTDKMQKAMKETLWFFVSEERWDEMRSRQIDFEAKVQTSKS